MTCQKYTRPKGVLGGPCLTCGGTYAEHEKCPSINLSGPCTCADARHVVDTTILKPFPTPWDDHPRFEPKKFPPTPWDDEGRWYERK